MVNSKHLKISTLNALLFTPSDVGVMCIQDAQIESYIQPMKPVPENWPEILPALLQLIHSRA